MAGSPEQKTSPPGRACARSTGAGEPRNDWAGKKAWTEQSDPGRAGCRVRGPPGKGNRFGSLSNSSVFRLQARPNPSGRIGTGKSGEEAFGQNRGLVFKQPDERRICEAGSDILTQASSSHTIIDGPAKTSPSSDPLRRREVTWNSGKPAAG